jgi:Spy/CpxP family protein refolding chaperone
MSDTQQVGQESSRRFWRRWFWISGGALAGLAALASMAPRAWAFRGFAGPQGPGFARHGFGGRGMHDPAQAKQHVGFAIEFALRGVNASEDQRQQVRRIAEGAIDKLAPLAVKHRAHREAMARELAKPEIDRAAVERLRKESIAMADEASKTIAGALTDAAEVLTPEQRGELIDLARRFHGEGPAD